MVKEERLACARVSHALRAKRCANCKVFKKGLTAAWVSTLETPTHSHARTETCTRTHNSPYTRQCAHQVVMRTQITAFVASMHISSSPDSMSYVEGTRNHVCWS